MRSLVFAGALLHALFLVTAPFEHHDLSCELKNPQHCTACTSSVLGPDPGTLASPGARQLADAGSAVPLQVLADSILLAVRTSGRSPPTPPAAL
jgi:hypothetical protein